MTRRKMDEENLAGIMFCFPNCNLFEGFNGCRIKTSQPRSGFIVCHPAMIDDPLFPPPRQPPPSFALPPPPPPRLSPAFSADFQGILNISYIYMDALVSN